MSSSIVQPVAARIGVLAGNIGLTPTVTAWVWEPSELGKLPAAVVRLPAVTRVGVEAGESQLGSFDWTLSFPVDLYFDLTGNTVAVQTQMADYLEKFGAQIDADPSLGGLVLDAKFAALGARFLADAQPRKLGIYECRIDALKLV